MQTVLTENILLSVVCAPHSKKLSYRDHDQNLIIVYFISCDQILPFFSGQPSLQVQKD